MSGSQALGPTASGGFSTTVGGRTVVVRVGAKSQALSICTLENRLGSYEWRFRFTGVDPLRRDDLVGFASLDALLKWIEGQGAAVRP